MLAADLPTLQGAHLDCRPLPGHGCRPGARPHPPSSPASTCWPLSGAQARPGREGPALAGLRCGSRNDGEAPRLGRGLTGRGSGALTQSWPSPGTRAQGPIPGGPTERGEGSWGTARCKMRVHGWTQRGQEGGREGRGRARARAGGGDPEGPRRAGGRARGEGAEGRQERAEAASLRRSPRAAPQTDRARPRRLWRQRQQQAAGPAPGRRRAGAGSERRSTAAPRRRLVPAAWTNTSAS